MCLTLWECTCNMWWQPLSPRTPDAKLSRWRWSTLFEPFTSSLLFDCICFFLNKERLSKQWKDRGHKRRGKMRRRKAKEGQCGNSWRLLYVWREKALRTQEIGLAYFGLGALGISVTVGWKREAPEVQRLMEGRQSSGCWGQNWGRSHLTKWAT